MTFAVLAGLVLALAAARGVVLLRRRRRRLQEEWRAPFSPHWKLRQTVELVAARAGTFGPRLAALGALPAQAAALVADFPGDGTADVAADLADLPALLVEVTGQVAAARPAAEELRAVTRAPSAKRRARLDAALATVAAAEAGLQRLEGLAARARDRRPLLEGGRDRLRDDLRPLQGRLAAVRAAAEAEGLQGGLGLAIIHELRPEYDPVASAVEELAVLQRDVEDPQGSWPALSERVRTITRSVGSLERDLDTAREKARAVAVLAAEEERVRIARARALEEQERAALVEQARRAAAGLPAIEEKTQQFPFPA